MGDLSDKLEKMPQESNTDIRVDDNAVTENESKNFERKIDEMFVDFNFENKVPRPLGKFKENKLKTEYVKVTPMVKKAYCPKCGKEIVSRGPVMYNPFTFESSCPYTCQCGWQGDLEYAYPRVIFVEDNGTQIEAYAK